uniref:RxLR effector candidate protein n=1 Tax=Hyaloperonospora arabidopsidis (strain Emoy2) TaxID=559515 RepID=M4B7S5_HYAAE
MSNDDRADAAEETVPEPDAPATPRSGTNKAKKPCACQAHGTRGATKRASSSQSGGASCRKTDGWLQWKKRLRLCRTTTSERSTRGAPGSNALQTNWVYKTKTTVDGELERLKAQLLAYGNERVLGVAYGLIFAAVMNLSTLKVILALADTWGVPAMHGDIPTRMSRRTKKAHSWIYLHLPRNMSVSNTMLREHGATSAK